MSIQTVSFYPSTTRSTATPNYITSGSTFDGQGNDFLSPKDILNNVDKLGGTISPITSPALFPELQDPFGNFADSDRILSVTDATVNNILSPTFGQSFLNGTTQIPTTTTTATANPFAAATGTGYTGIPAAYTNSNTIYSQLYRAPSQALIQDLSNYNPLIWQNPSSPNVLLGTMDVTNKIFGGNGIFSTGTQYPLYPYIQTPSSPYGSYNIQVPTYGTPNTYNQAMLYPSTFNSNSPYYSWYAQPYAMASTQSVTTYGNLVGLTSALQNAGSATGTGSGLTLNQLESANGVPPWIA